MPHFALICVFRGNFKSDNHSCYTQFTLANHGILRQIGRNCTLIKIMFVCHGNICRSPMAEFIFRDMVKKGEIADRFVINHLLRVRRRYGTGLEILFIRRLSVSLQNTESVVTARGLFSSKNPTMTSTIISSAWTLIISETLCEFSVMTKTERFAR